MTNSDAIKKVLVVDDSDSILRLIDKQLRTQGFEVSTVESAERAIKWCQKNGPPDLVLTDISMPDISGPVLGRVLNLHYPDLPVLFMSGTEQIVNNGASALLPKPFTQRELISMVNATLLEHSWLRKAAF